jgi:hypothetical protein
MISAKDLKMFSSKKLSALSIIAAATLQVLQANAGDAISAPGQKSIGQRSDPSIEIIPELAVLNSGGAKLQDGKLILSAVTDNAIVFTDRPIRAAGHVLTTDFIKQWGDGTDSFKADPPNATISVLDKSGSTVKDAVVMLESPSIEGNNLAFDVKVLEGDLVGADGPAALFIDWFSGHHGSSAHANDDLPKPAFKAGWYHHDHSRGLGYAAIGALGAATGLVAAGVPATYDYPPYTGYAPYQLYPASECGYYPEPPCY